MTRTIREIANAEIVPNMGSTNSWLVRFGEGDYDTLNKSAKNRLLLKEDVLDRDTFTFGGVTVSVDFQNDEYVLRRDANTVRVPNEKEEHVLWSIYDEDGPRLNKLFDELYEPTVRKGLMDMLMPRFREGDNIRKTDDGWVVNEDILVAWDAHNHPVDVYKTHVVEGGEAVEADTDKQAREINFHVPDNTDVTLPNGTKTTLDDVEVKFLTTVGLIVGQSGTGLYDDALASAIDNSRVHGFTDTKSGLHHGHSLDKHRLEDLNVTDEAIDRLWYNSYDHAGVHELYKRRREFENAPVDVFTDAPNDDASKWQKIKNTSQKAPIPKHVKSDLAERY